jgi:hypothetical protein
MLLKSLITQDLMGKVDNNLIEIETNFENRLEKSYLFYKMLYLLSQIKD